MTAPDYATLDEGAELPGLRVQLRRSDLVRYAGASGDFNVIHWNERVARDVGLPDVIAHGMLTMASAVRIVTDWVGDPGAIVEYGVRFTRPVVVPDDDAGAELEISAVVKEKLPDSRVRVDITARCGGDRILSMARAVVVLAERR